MNTKQQFKRIDYASQSELEQKLLEKLDLTRLGELWKVEEESTDHQFWQIEGKDWIAALSPLQTGDTRGRYMVDLYSRHPGEAAPRPRGWPRFFFDQHRAKLEVEYWLVFNGQVPLPSLRSTETKNAA